MNSVFVAAFIAALLVPWVFAVFIIPDRVAVSA
jgi:hypothetical protein